MIIIDQHLALAGVGRKYLSTTNVLLSLLVLFEMGFK